MLESDNRLAFARVRNPVGPNCSIHCPLLARAISPICLCRQDDFHAKACFQGYFADPLVDLERATRDTAGAGTDEDPHGLLLKALLIKAAGKIQFFRRSDQHLWHPPAIP